MSATVRISKRTAAGLRQGASFDQVLDGYSKGGERWLFVSPHDDDIVIGAGMLLQQAVAESVAVKILITTDGSLGYVTADQEHTIREIRRKETLDSFALLGIRDVEWLDFPDAGLSRHQGRHAARPGDPCVIAGYSGVENAYTYHIRKAAPTRIFVPAGSDYHPDHKTVYQELLISIFHSVNGIWPELGDPVPAFPRVTEMAVYCDFDREPDLSLEAPAEFLEKKLNAIEAYASQKKIIRSLVDNLRKEGPFEYFRDTEFTLYRPSKYGKLFRR